jgi:DNA polymerase-1
VKKILLVDATNFLYRAYHAMPPLTTKDGRPTAAVRGFLSMIKSLRRDIPSDYFACVFDPKGGTFRNEIYPEYKANRPPMPDDLRSQIELVHEAVKMEGWPLLIVPGVEADDTIGTLATKAEKDGFDVVIATGDKDYAQLVSGSVHLVNTMGEENKWLGREEVKEKFGVYPEQIIDFLALIGDKVDNVPGIQKCGEKTAVKWLTAYGSVEKIIENADKVTGKIGENLRAGLDFLPVAQDLVTIRRNVDLSAYVPDWSALEVKACDRSALFELYQSLEFRRWADELKKGPVPGSVAPVDGAPKEALDLALNRSPAARGEMDLFADNAGEAQVEILRIESEAEALRALKDIQDAGRKSPTVLFVLADSAEQQEALPAAAAFAVSPSKVYAVTLAAGLGSGLDLSGFQKVFGAFLSDAASSKAAFEGKFLKHVFANAGIAVQGLQDDLQLLSYVLESHRSHTIVKIARDWLNTELEDEEQLRGKGAKQKAWSEVPEADVIRFAATRAAHIARLIPVLKSRLETDPRRRSIYETIEMPLLPVLFRMEQNGVLIDSGLLARQTAFLQVRIDELTAEAHAIAGAPFKLNSPKELGEVLFDKLGATMDGVAPKKTATGNYSTNEEVLSELSLDYPLARVALEYRGLTKLTSTYTDKLPKLVSPKDGRLHTTFEQAVAVTGRLSSTNPNLQNIPVRTKEGREVREAFIAGPGSKIISADYSQIELRIMAHLSKDARLLEAFHKGEDVHRATASEVFRVPLDAVTSDQRRIAKVVNFGLIYGMSTFGLAKNLGIERGAAKNYIERYFEHFPGVRRYMDETRRKAASDGFVETVFGRKLFLPDILARGPRRAAAERAAINAPMQGTAADLIKLAMISVQKWLEDEKLASRLILQVHDELILEVPEEEVELVKGKLPELMQNVAQLDIPLIAEVGVGDSWEAAH